MQFIGFHKIRHLLQAFPGPLALHSMINQESLSHGSAEGIHHANGPGGVPAPQLLGSQDGSSIGRAEPGGKSQHQNILPCLQNRSHEGAPPLRVNGCGAGRRAGSECAVKRLDVQTAPGIAVQKILIFRSLKLDAKRGVGHAQASGQGERQVTGGVSEDLVVCDHREPSVS